MPKKSTKKKTETKRKLSTYVIIETITIEQEIPAWSDEDALRKYQEMMDDKMNRFELTQEGCTSTSSTTTHIEIENLADDDSCDSE